MNLRLRPFSTSLTLSLLLAANTVAAAAPFNRVRVPINPSGTPSKPLPPALELSGVESSLDFGQVQVAQQVKSSTLVVSNKGKWTATALGVLAPAGFNVVDSNCGTELKPGSSCSFALTFTPTQPGTYSGSVTAGSANGGSVQLQVAGAGVGATMELGDINFGGVMDGTRRVHGALLSNAGVGSVRLGTPRVSGQGFALAAGSNCGAVLAPGASCLLNVELAATGVTAHAGTLTVPTVEAGELQASLSAQSRKTFNVDAWAVFGGSSSVLIPAGVSSVTLIGVGGDGYEWGDGYQGEGPPTTANLGGQEFRFSGGWGVGPVPSVTFTKTLTAGPAQTLSFNVPFTDGGRLRYKYSYTLPY